MLPSADAEGGTITYDLDVESTNKIIDSAEKYDIPTSVVILHAIRTVLSKFNNNEKDVTIRNFVSRRSTLLNKKCGGVRMHCLPLRTIIEPTATVLESMQIINKEQRTDMLYLGDILEEYKGKTPSASSSESDLTAILFTSGTTGKSKGVMLSNGNLIDNATCEPDLGYHGNKRMTVLPIHHVFCFTCDILCSLWYGRKLCINDSLMRIIKNLKLFRPVDVTFVPMISASILTRMKQMAGEDGDKLAVGREVFGENFSIVYSGGAYLSPDIIKGYAEFGIEIAQGYGMTECSPRICSGVKNCPKPDSVGEIVPGCEVRIVDGEIQVKSKSVMMGYYKDPEETAKSISEDGWLMTGDLGYKDDDGYLYITGRKKNLIILSNGENVSPEEIENQFAYFAPVKEIVVYDKNGQITAEIYPDPDYECDDIRAVLQQKIDAVNDTFPAAKQIVNLVIRDREFEKTASKKIIRSSITK